MDRTDSTVNQYAEARTLMVPLTRRECILALYAAVGAKKRKDLPESAWTQVQLSDGALD